MPKIVLVVDDDPVSLLLVANIVSKCGYTCLRADRPSRAIELFEQYGALIELLVTDVNMPELNGFALGELLRRRNSSCPVICMSAATPSKEQLEKGFYFIKKPFGRESLIRIMSAALAPGDFKAARLLNEMLSLQPVKRWLSPVY
jgi:DNA-binding response OmpR family regulator